MSNDIAMIKASGLFYEYRQMDETPETALNGIDLVINKGEFTAILGHNGSGKSTLAKHINALLQPTHGTIWVAGYDTKMDEHIWKIRQSAGMVFQNPDNQIVASIVEEDIAFGPENLGIHTDEIRKRVDDALSAVGMTAFASNSPHNLSGGQKQRVAIAGVLAMKPACIILDEPTAMLDPIGRRDVIDTIIRLNKEEHITVVLITHYMDEAVKADRVVVMDAGKIVMDGAPKQVFRRVGALKAIGLDVPQVTETAHRLKSLGFDLPDDILTISEMTAALMQLFKQSQN